ncbi:MAG TPA: hypothetical protein VFI74_02235 [Candidatus Saccharimonadales bacterium]|nr:hypothetical protein [Candidatus Saccharimonadales bacterium]
MEFSHFGQQDQDPLNGEKHSRRDHEFSIAAGRIVTSGEAAAAQRRNQALRAPESIIDAALNKDAQPNEADPNVETRQSAWHTYHIDKRTGKTLDNPDAMGKEFTRELQPEQDAASSQALPSEPAATPTVQPIQSPIVPILPRRQQFSNPSPAYAAPGTTPAPVQPPLGSTPAEPVLPSGMQADEQHRLPAPAHPVMRVVKSPWLWLAVGVAMIWYFAKG